MFYLLSFRPVLSLKYIFPRYYNIITVTSGSLTVPDVIPAAAVTADVLDMTRDHKRRVVVTGGVRLPQLHQMKRSPFVRFLRG